jgi:hypothetical protein
MHNLGCVVRPDPRIKRPPRPACEHASLPPYVAITVFQVFGNPDLSNLITYTYKIQVVLKMVHNVYVIRWIDNKKLFLNYHYYQKRN